MKRLTLPVALLLATVSTSSWAQTAADHKAHHPDQKGPPAATQPQSPPGQPGMVGQGVMGGPQGMMGGRGMMGGNHAHGEYDADDGAVWRCSAPEFGQVKRGYVFDLRQKARE
jgi:hypothetical protein